MRFVLQNSAYISPTLFLLLVFVGDTYREPQVTTWIALFLLIVLFWWSFLGEKATSNQMEKESLWAKRASSWWIRVSALFSGGLLWLLLSHLKYQGMEIYPNHSVLLETATAVAVFLLLILLIKPPKIEFSLLLLVIAALAIRTCSVLQWEINPARRDMLALVISAIETFLSGENPYAFHQMQPGSQVPLTYPPGLWLAHLPAYVLGLDIRWTSWVSDGIIAFAIGGATILKNRKAFGPVCLALATYLFLPDTHWNAIYAEPTADWAVLALVAAAAIMERPLATGCIYGLALTTRPFNLVLLPFLVVWLVRRHGFRCAWNALLCSGCVALVLYLPFVWADPDAFYVGTVRWLLDYGPTHHRWFRGMLGFSGYFYTNDLAEWLTIIQAGSTVTLTVLAIWKLRTTKHLLAFWCAAYALFVAFNSIIWMSFWIGVCILAIAILGATNNPQVVSPVVEGTAGRRKTIWLVFGIAATILVFFAGTFLVLRLLEHFSDDGKEETQSYLLSNAEPGDMIIDRTGWRVAFLRMPYILEREQLPRGVSLSEDPYSQVLPKAMGREPLGAGKVWVVERYNLFDPISGVYLGQDAHGISKSAPYEVISKERLGLFNIYKLLRKRNGDLIRLSSMVQSLDVSVRKGQRRIPAELNGDIWRFPGGRNWQYLGPRGCRFGRFRHRMLWAHPWPDAVMSVRATLKGEPRWVSVYGGLNEKSASWHMAPVKVRVLDLKGGLIGEMDFPNDPDLHGTTFVIPAGVESLTFEVSATDVSRRHFCLDASFF